MANETNIPNTPADQAVVLRIPAPGQTVSWMFSRTRSSKFRLTWPKPTSP